jgi:hypothetical protein
VPRNIIHWFCTRVHYLLPSLYAAAFVRRTTSSTDLHPFLKRSLYLLRFNHFIVYTGCGTFLKRVCHNTRTLLSYLHFYARTYKSIYRLITKTHPSMHIILVKSKTHPSMHIYDYLLHRNCFLLINMLENGMSRVLLLANRKTVK